MSEFRASLDQITGGLDYPMLIVTTLAGEEMSGCLVGFATQCSVEPPHFLVCISDKNRTYRVARHAEALAVHFPPPTATELAALFGSETDDTVDKFAHCAWHRGPRGLPILDQCPRWFAGSILERLRLGDHVGFQLEPFAAAAEGDPATLTFSQTKDLEPGHRA